MLRSRRLWLVLSMGGIYFLLIKLMYAMLGKPSCLLPWQLALVPELSELHPEEHLLR
jgi:hypothetical protein